MTLAYTITMSRLGDVYEERGKKELFQRLRSQLVGEGDEPSYAQVAEELSMTEGAVKVAVHRMRRGFATELRGEITETLANAADVDDEIRHLFAALSSRQI